MVRGSAYINEDGTMDQIVMEEQICTALDTSNSSAGLSVRNIIISITLSYGQQCKTFHGFENPNFVGIDIVYEGEHHARWQVCIVKLPPRTGTSFSRSTTTTGTTTQATSKSTSTTTEIGIDTTTDTLTDTGMVTRDAATATVTNTKVFLKEVLPVTTTLTQDAVTDTMALIEGTIIEKVDTATITLLPEPVVETFVIVMDRDPETIIVSGETVVIAGKNRTYTQELEDTHVHDPKEYTTKTYTTTLTDPSTYVSTYPTTRMLHPVYTYIGEDTIIEQAFKYIEISVPLFFTSEPDPEPTLIVAETQTVIEWQHRKYYHKGSNQECYKDDEDKEDDEDEDDDDNDNDNNDDDDNDKDNDHKKKHYHKDHDDWLE